MPNDVLRIYNVSKSYGRIQALRGLSFSVPEGSVFGVLGPNGSGKTTLLGILLDVLLADGGTYQWFQDMPAHEARRQIGSLLETPNFYHYLSAWDNLKINAAIKGQDEKDFERVLKLTNLWERRHSKFSTYSLGMKQRLAIAAALLGRPRVLVLDEPTNGLDPSGIAEIRQLIRQMRQEGITVLMASHLLDEVEKVCTHMAILKTGMLLVTGPVEEVLRSEDLIEVKTEDMELLQHRLRDLPGVQRMQISDSGLLQVYVDSSLSPALLNAHCMQHGIVLSHLSLKKKSLETKFMELTETASLSS